MDVNYFYRLFRQIKKHNFSRCTFICVTSARSAAVIGSGSLWQLRYKRADWLAPTPHSVVYIEYRMARSRGALFRWIFRLLSAANCFCAVDIT
jgi:hypothetical protein